MRGYLLDTNIIIDVLRGDRARVALLRGFVEGGGFLACCPITVAEIHPGMKESERERTEELLNSLTYFGITREVARTAGSLKRDFAQRGRTLLLPDAFIAAVALAHDLIVVTRNVKDFQQPGLMIHPVA